MSSVPFSSLLCPLDQHPLYRDGMTWRCASGHSFDVAREGYTYLLPVQKKRSLDPGDSKAMVAARRRFLSAGHYRPIADAVSQKLLSAGTGAESVQHYLDAGCGEGYYLRALLEAASGLRLSVLGLDISKWAIQSAAKQDKAGQVAWIVASNANIPTPSASMDGVLCLFGFPVYPEFARVMRPGGLLLQVDAAPEHLKELREIIYPVVNAEPKADYGVPEGFELRSVEHLAFPLHLKDPESIADLLAMTPHLYRATAEGKAKAAALTELSVSVAVRVLCLIRI